MRVSARLTLAITASTAVVFAAPLVGDIRAAIQTAFPGQYRRIVIALVMGAVLVAVCGAVLWIRDRRVLRFGLLSAALAIGALYTAATSSGNAEVDAVERFHFVEYGVIALLYYRVWRDRGDLSAVALPFCAGLIVGVADEWLQWFVPFRVGELRDVLLNGVALACGLLFGAAVHLPSGGAWLPPLHVRATLARVAAVTLVAVAALFHTVHLGHEVRVAETHFRSRFSAAALIAASEDRARRWSAGAPVESRFSREDHYLSEARWHLEERNEAVAAGDAWTAWHEQAILDGYYAPVLSVLPGVRWPPEQRAEIEARAGGAGVFVSDAQAHPIYPWNPVAVWLAVAAAVAPLEWLAQRSRAERIVQQPA